jgi:hypothetical protein
MNVLTGKRINIDEQAIVQLHASRASPKHICRIKAIYISDRENYILVRQGEIDHRRIEARTYKPASIRIQLECCWIVAIIWQPDGDRG